MKDIIVERLSESFKFPIDKKPRDSKPCRIKWNGQFVQLESLKTIWSRKMYAKSAFKNHVMSIFYRGSCSPQYGEEYKFVCDNYDQLIKEWIDNKTLEFVEI